MRWLLFLHFLGVLTWAGGSLSLALLKSRPSRGEAGIYFFVLLPGLFLIAATGLALLHDPVMLWMQFGWMRAKVLAAMALMLFSLGLGHLALSRIFKLSILSVGIFVVLYLAVLQPF
jgi:hypothetical protein